MKASPKTKNKRRTIHTSPRDTLMTSTHVAIVLALILAFLSIMLANRLQFSWQWQVGKLTKVSERTRTILGDTQGSIRVTCFMRRDHPMFRPVTRLLRGLQQAARSEAGAELQLTYIDPRWDMARAGQLVAQGLLENSLIFEKQHRRQIATLEEMMSQAKNQQADQYFRARDLGTFHGESVCAAAIARLALPYEQATIYWLQGHGEARFNDHDELHGFSDIARELRRNGFELQTRYTAELQNIKDELHALVIAGPRYALQPEELTILDQYLARGGRLLYLHQPQQRTGLETLMARWGIHIRPHIATSPQTLSGIEAVLSHFADHTITRNLQNAAVVFGHAACLTTTPQAARETDADLPQVTLLALTGSDGWGESHPDLLPRTFDPPHDLPGPVAVAAASERGTIKTSDLTYRPTRICVFGEADFIKNGILDTRANANRDLFMNAIAWLTGLDIGSAHSLGGDTTLVTGFARRQWLLLMLYTAGIIPLAAFGLFYLNYLLEQR